jgi:hypothetical protein
MLVRMPRATWTMLPIAHRLGSPSHASRSMFPPG